MPHSQYSVLYTVTVKTLYYHFLPITYSLLLRFNFADYKVALHTLADLQDVENIT